MQRLASASLIALTGFAIVVVERTTGTRMMQTSTMRKLRHGWESRIRTIAIKGYRT